MNIKSTLTLCAALCLPALGCTDDESVTPLVDAAVEVPVADAGAVAPTPTPEADAGAASAPIPLLLWVDDLVDHHSTDDATPDTVDDKNIVDDESPTAYDARFQ
jgi:hypothetical protein